MVLPPVLIKIKRKRTDEPVDLLHVQEPLDKKQRCATEYVFCRQSRDDFSVAAASYSSKSAQITPIVESQSSFSVTESCGELKAARTSCKNTVPRCFHICRSITPTETADRISTLNRKRKAETIFIERKPNQDLRARLNSNKISSLNSFTQASQIHQTQPREAPGIVAPNSTPPVKAQTSAPIRNVHLPCGTLIPWDVKPEELAAQMQEYTLAEIKKNINESKTEHTLNQETPKVSASLQLKNENLSTRFKPKVPALRYKDRHPDKVDLDEDTKSKTGLDKPIEDQINCIDWVTETYLRMPISELGDSHAERFSSYGFLVLDSQEEMDEFYQNELDFEDEDDEDDEDENAENHHSADYPDEEVASDDEFGHGAYLYTNDLNEFQPDTLSDDEEEQRMRYPWMKTLWPVRREETDIDQSSNDEDGISHY